MKATTACLLSIFATASAVGPLISGGVEATPHEFPFVVNINWRCAGAIYSNEWILTSAECLSPGLSSTITIGGAHNLSSPGFTNQFLQGRKIIQHPEYTPAIGNSPALNDIALLLVAPPFRFNSFVQPIQLAESQPSLIATTMGWGKELESDEDGSRVLRKISIPHVAHSDCETELGTNLTDSILCYGEPGRGVCDDSGSPLVCNEVLCGIASSGCKYPSIFSEVSKFQAFIHTSTIPIAEDAQPAVETTNCEDNLVATSGLITISPSTAKTTCIWTLQVPRSAVRFRILSGNLTESTVHITEYNSLRPITDESNTIQLTTVGVNYTLYFGPLFFMTLTPSPLGLSSPLVIEFYGSRYTDKIYNITTHEYVYSNSYSYPKHGGYYQNDEFNIFIAKPDHVESSYLKFTDVDIQIAQDCSLVDVLEVYSWSGNEMIPLFELCGGEIPAAFISPTALFVLIFKSDAAYTAGGFKFVQGSGVPLLEDSQPALTSTTCGGILAGTSGKIVLSASSVLPDMRCSWVLQIPRTATRLRVLSDLTQNELFVTEFVHYRDFITMNGPRGPTTNITTIGTDYVFRKSLLFLTLSTSPDALSSPLIIEYYGSEFVDETYLTHIDFIEDSTANYNYPVGGGNYQNDEFSLFIVNPKNKSNFAFNFTRLDMESAGFSCIDGIRVFSWTGANFDIEGQSSACKDFPYFEPVEISTGLAILTFYSSRDVTQSGFEFSVI